MEPILADFTRLASEVSYSAPAIKIIANVTGDLATDALATPTYWAQHIRQAVQFADGMQTLAQLGADIFLEIGPQPTLLGMGRRCLPGGGVWLPSLRPGQADWAQMLDSLGHLYVQGLSIDWRGFEQDYRRRKVILPAYPFARERYWINNKKRTQKRW